MKPDDGRRRNLRRYGIGAEVRREIESHIALRTNELVQRVGHRH